MESLSSISAQSAFNLNNVFDKYDSGRKGFLTKTEFKCAFIFITGLKPSKDDMQVVK
jgi:hypothetical protein